eukprot:2369165-Pyramimonas_sp.AAC.1
MSKHKQAWKGFGIDGARRQQSSSRIRCEPDSKTQEGPAGSWTTSITPRVEAGRERHRQAS